METILFTAFVGIGLLACGFWLGRQGEDQAVATALRAFIEEMVNAKLINEKKLNAYIIKNYDNR